MPCDEFEVWLHAQEQLEAEFGEPLYLDVVSVDYRDRNAVFVIRETLAAVLRPSLTCECVTLADLAVVRMGGDGLDERVFATLESVRRHGGAQWWLYLAGCTACGEAWMVAQEERIFDDHFLRRLTDAETDQIGTGGPWPADFTTYERVLSVGQRLSRPCRFDDPLAMSLVWTAQDLRKARPGITAEEIARLIGVRPRDVGALLAANAR